MSNEQYGVEQISVLSQLEHVRLRPAMYIGTVSDARGPAQMAFEIVDNAVDEHEAGFGDEITVTVAKDFTVTVNDHGRGIPVGPHPTAKDADGNPVDTLTLALTTLNAGGKFKVGEDDAGYAAGVSGMHGVGSSVVQMLSDSFEVTVRRDGAVYHQTFSRGNPTSPVVKQRAMAAGEPTGTEVVYHPDPTIFTHTLNPGERLPSRLNELASLNPGLTIDYTGPDGLQTKFHYDDGLAGLVLRDIGTKTRLHEGVWSMHGVYGEGPERVTVDLAFAYDDDQNPGNTVRCFANNVSTVDGGTHKLGLRAGLREAVNARAQSLKITKSPLDARYVEDGLHAAVAVKLANAELEGQTKGKLGNKCAQTAVEEVMRAQFVELLKDKSWSTALDAIAMRAVRVRDAEEAARRARTAARKTKEVAKAESLPGKLAECTNANGYREIFIVEGDSAAGCFVGDTRVPLVDGRVVTMEQLAAEHTEGKTNYVYAVDEQQNICVQPVVNAWQTKTVTKLAVITLDNGEQVRCTVDHPIMCRNGTYCQAAKLMPGQSLMPMYTCTSASTIYRENPGTDYLWVLNPRNDKWRPVCKITATQYHGRQLAGKHVHHVDHDSRNDTPENIMYMDAKEHMSLHNRERDASALIAAHAQHMREDPEYFEHNWRKMHTPEAAEKRKVSLHRFFDEHPEAKTHLAAKANEEWANPELRAWRAEMTRKQMNDPHMRDAIQAGRDAYQERIKQDKTAYTEYTRARMARVYESKRLKRLARLSAVADWFTTHGMTGTMHEYRVHADALRAEVHVKLPWPSTIRRLFKDMDAHSLTEWLTKEKVAVAQLQPLPKAKPPVNHKVRSVEIITLDEPVPVYDLEVPPHANFALAAGVFVHNSAKEGRYREFQAILALRGKILNVSKADLERMLTSETIRNIIISLGAGVGKEFNINKLRYEKIIIMTDADVDGQHIRSLLLTLFYYYMRQLITDGHVYIAVPPLYRVVMPDASSVYLVDDDALEQFKKIHHGQKYDIGRYKGLGEMNPLQLKETTLDPATRTLRRITLTDAAAAATSFETMMGKATEPRRQFIDEHALNASALTEAV